MPPPRTRSPPDRSLSASRRSASPRRRESVDHRSRSPRRERSPVLDKGKRSERLVDEAREGEEEAPPLSVEDAPPLPDEHAPPLPLEPAPGTTPFTAAGNIASNPQDSADDGWQPIWDDAAQTYYFYNRFTESTQWENPRIPEIAEQAPGVPAALNGTRHAATDNQDHLSILPAAAGGYNPRIHGSYDPNASYAQPSHPDPASDTDTLIPHAPGTEPSSDTYTTTASFTNRNGAFSNLAAHPTHTPTAHTDEAKSKRQMAAFFDVDAAANSHDGRSLKEERRGRKLTKEEVRAFREKAKGRREEKRRRWLRD
ncbi:MAG: hypothetical protein M1828_005052 [Chrysothrix sp. TS-e1954]|nr:MAG: hypothetical protein M1828_005052 [Chrysothrix sp. TS-e1954]